MAEAIFRADGIAATDKASLLKSVNIVSENGILTDAQAELIKSVFSDKFDESGEVVINDTLAEVVSQNPDAFPEFRGEDVSVNLTEEGSGRVVMLAFGVGIVAGILFGAYLAM